jgi:phosphate acyltransferase
MGGDNAPSAIVEGAIKAVERGDIAASDIVLIGAKDRIGELIREKSKKHLDFGIENANQTVEMNESPVDALRKKRESSIAVGIHLLKARTVDAMISAGNTGAMVAFSTLRLGMLKGVKRPGIAVCFTSLSGACTIIDVGANIHCKPMHLYHYGIMASSYMRHVMNTENPRVAMINIGEENEKGTALLKETRNLFKDSHINFIGNLEGQDIFSGKCDVLVCEGFVGNVVLKVAEGLGAYIYKFLLSDMDKEEGDSEKKAISMGILKDIYSRLDYAEYGGAPLLGVNGNVFICHGRSDPKAISNAIRFARLSVDNKLIENIASGLES